MKFIYLIFCFSVIWPDLSLANSRSRAFGLDLLKELQGEWAIKSGSKPLEITMKYDVGSKGSIVTEQFGKELTVFYEKNGDLLMMHYCNAGNRPLLKLTDFSKSTAQFETIEVNGTTPLSAAHVHKVIYRFPSNERIDLEIVWKKESEFESERYVLTKLSPSASKR